MDPNKSQKEATVCDLSRPPVTTAQHFQVLTEEKRRLLSLYGKLPVKKTLLHGQLGVFILSLFCVR